jgi:hypothetical protein
MCRIHHTHGVITLSEEALHVTEGMQISNFLGNCKTSRRMEMLSIYFWIVDSIEFQPDSFVRVGGSSR